MNTRALWIWASIAGALFAFIFFYQQHAHRGPAGPAKILPNFKVAQVSTVQVRPEGQLEIRAVRTNDGWQLNEPLLYPAQASSIENLLFFLDRMTPATYISRRELRQRPEAEEEYGFGAPQSTLIVKQGEYRVQIFVGSRTAPGNEVFLQVVGDEGVYVVDAELLHLLPRNANEWRDTAFLDLPVASLERIAVTNGSKSFELQRNGPKGPWRMALPGFQARANSAKIEELLASVRDLRVRQFISDDPKPDLDSLGLQTPDLQIAFGQGSNTLTVAQFSAKGPTNEPARVYARRLGERAIVVVETNLLGAWRAQANEFRDSHLVSLAGPVTAIAVRGQDQFTLLTTNGSVAASRESAAIGYGPNQFTLLSTNGHWQIVPGDTPADSGMVSNLLSMLTGMPIVQFVKDVVPEPDLAGYGLAPAALEYTLMGKATNAAGSNNVIAILQFGTNQEERVFARRADEPSVYAVRASDVQSLGTRSWHFRERRVWDVSEDDLSGVTVYQGGKVRQALRKAQYEWSLLPGSQGSIESLSIEETVRALCHLTVSGWIASGEATRATYGFTNECPHTVTLDLKNGSHLKFELGMPGPLTFPYGGVNLGSDFLVFDFPPLLCRDVLAYLSIPVSP
jgi:hypothetical protein